MLAQVEISMDTPKRTPTITADSFLPDVIVHYPSTSAVLDRYGLQGCGGPLGPCEQVGWFATLNAKIKQYGIHVNTFSSVQLEELK